MQNELISVKLIARDYNELYKIYEGLWANYEAENAHELLLKGHVTDLYRHLEFRVLSKKKTYTLSFTGTMALAFVQLWEPREIPLNPLQAQVIQSIFLALDKVVVGRRAFRRILNSNH